MSMKDLYSEFLLNGGSFGSTLLKGEINHTILKSLYRKMGHSDYKNILNTPKKMGGPSEPPIRLHYCMMSSSKRIQAYFYRMTLSHS